MADIIRGTNIADPIVPYTTADNIPTHYAKYGKGGFRTVETIEERNSIPLERRESGMLVYVITDENNVHTYQWFPVDDNPEGEWKRSKMGGGDSIPIYDTKKLNELGSAAEEDYIFIPSESDMEGEVIGNTYTTTKNGSYVDVLFSAIRELQSEVARLRNAFNYGIYSYSGTDTAMSRVQGVYEGDVEEEPLWAIDEDGLSLQEDLISKITTDFEPQGNIEYTLEKRLPNFTNLTTWYDNKSGIIKEVEDSKLFLYITASNSNITINLRNKDEEGPDFTELELSPLLSNVIHLDWYNILVVISRKQKVENGDNINYLGSNFIWISVSNPISNNVILEGYFDLSNQNLSKTLVTVSKRYTISSIDFGKDLVLSKAIIYSKYQDFSQEVIPSTPTDSGFSYKAAHITIRSVSTFNVLDTIKNQLPENELIFVEDTKKLYIKNNYRLVAISGAGDEQQPPGDDTMTAEEILQTLAEKGIISLDPITGKYTGLQPLDGITLINEETGKQFEITIDAYGEINIREISRNEKTLEDRLSVYSDFPPDEKASWDNWRGFVGQLRIKEENISEPKRDAGLCSDRIKIGSFYAPSSTQLTFGCSHGFIELENTSDTDFHLDGCYLHYARTITGGDVQTSHLKLTGKVPANGTYLVRCKQYADLNDPNTFIKVKTYDIEWYDKDITITDKVSGNDTDESGDGKLIDLSHNGAFDADPHGLALTYGKTFSYSGADSVSKTFTYNCKVWTSSIGSGVDVDTKKAKYLYWPRFIDAVYYNAAFTTGGNENIPYWTILDSEIIRMASCINGADSKDTSEAAKIYFDAIYKNTFELDPAKQAYQSLNTYDSSRYRNANIADYQYILLNNEYISFPKTDEVYPVTKFTPKASFEKKNVLTDKNKLDPEKPSCVTCSFGINPYTTRTFNWVSSGYFDEYVWIRVKNSTEWSRFSSYTKKAEGTTATQSSNCPRRREFDAEINNIVYSRIYGYFPGDKNCTYTSHKCILDIVETAVNSKTTYEYVVGRSLANGTPDPSHSSDIMTFTLYPEDYSLRIYQTTDQQGFHWIEYQAWGAAANYINNQIKEDCNENNIIPILMNTGDMTQSGCRVNEWVDYYNAGKHLFDHLEQVNCVGNNDLCGTIVTDLGTGDDIGKSNSFYFHVFYCYEVDTTEGMVPIVRGKYVPSLYHIDFKNFRLVVVNSEITYENCKSWYKMVIKSDGSLVEENMFNENNKEIFNQNIANKVYQVINIYTGWTVEGTSRYYNNTDFTSIYTILYHMLNDTSALIGKKCIVACHEMPFTVITKENLAEAQAGKYRSANGTSLVGSHLNQLTTSDTNSIHWFSRLLESSGVRLCIGGHKHTYAITWPVREHYYYKTRINQEGQEIEEWVSSLENGPMEMEENLANDKDNVSWMLPDGATFDDASKPSNVISNSANLVINLTKYPIIEGERSKIETIKPNKYIIPGTISNTDYGVIYHMCQATGFKLMSNKELPAPEQVFTRYFPHSQLKYDGDGNVTESKASGEQRRPMYSIIDLKKVEHIGTEEENPTVSYSYDIIGKLIRLTNIQKAAKKLFNQLVHGVNATVAEYLYDNSITVTDDDVVTESSDKTDWKYGGWRTGQENIINITQR